MKALLLLKSSLFNGNGQSSRLAEAFVRARKAAGITKVTFVHAEGLAIDEATREKALQEARRKIATLNEAEVEYA